MAEKKVIVDNKDEKKKAKGLGGCLVILLILFLTPLLALSAFYMFNRDFKLNVNGLMSNAPGALGDYFEKFPTRAEELEQIRIVSSFILGLEQDRAVDKLLLLQNDDPRIYDDVIKDMLRINPNKTRTILEGLRTATVNKDVLSNTVQSISEEQNKLLKDTANYISGLPSNAAVDEVMKIIDDSINGHKNAAEIMEYIDDQVAVSIMYQLDVGDRNRIFASLSEAKALSIRNAYSMQQRRIADLVQIADVYRAEVTEGLINTIGNTQTYSYEDLAVIYKTLGSKKAGEVLAKVEDDAFVFDVVAKIKANELLEKSEDLITPDILKSLKIYREFDDNVSELIKVYSKMEVNKVVEIVRNMMLNASPSQVYTLDNGEIISISDEDLIMQILKSFPQDKIAAILSSLDQTLSSELTRKLTLPKQ